MTRIALLALAIAHVSIALACAQEQRPPAVEAGRPEKTEQPPRPPEPGDPPPEPGGPPSGFPGPRPMLPMPEEVKLVTKFDADGNGRLDTAERKAAREFLAKDRDERRAARRRPPLPPQENQTPTKPGAKLTPADVKSFRAMPFYDLQTLRTLFFEFEDAGWEKELADFKDTDVDVPAKLTVDGKTYDGVGVHFRGASSFMMVGEGRKRSLGVSIDFTGEKQRLQGYRSLDLLNSHGDPTFLRTVLYYQIAREFLPAPKANYVRVVINGESWGVYVNSQPFNKDFIDEWFDTKKGVRWKAPGSPMGRSGLEYLGDEVEPYRARFEIKSKDTPKAWESLIRLCRVLNQTPAEELEKAISPLLDLEDALTFLALENVFINNDGYWIRASDYNLYEDFDGCFHIIPHDVNETFSIPGGPGFTPGAGRMKGVELDPLAGADDPKKPLLSKLLAVPALRARYLTLVREIAERWLDWKRLEPYVEHCEALIADEVKADTRKLDSTEAFEKGATQDIEKTGGRGPRLSVSLKNFVEQRRAYLLAHPEIKKSASRTARAP